MSPFVLNIKRLIRRIHIIDVFNINNKHVTIQ